MDKLLKSSQNPEKLAMTITGILVLVAGTLLPKANLGQDQIANIVDSILNTGKMTVTLGGMILTIFGAIRKLWNQVKDAYKK